MSKKPELMILDDVYNLGFLDGMADRVDQTTLKLVRHLSLLKQFQEEYDVEIEYTDGFQEGKHTRTLNLMKEHYA